MWNGFCPFWNTGTFGTWGWIGMALYLLFWAALIVGVIYLIIRIARRVGPTVPFSTTGPEITAPLSAIELAKMRYARGEIDREAYLKLVEDLQ
jgi:uncharacterized membrane protein